MWKAFSCRIHPVPHESPEKEEVLLLSGLIDEETMTQGTLSKVMWPEVTESRFYHKPGYSAIKGTNYRSVLQRR